MSHHNIMVTVYRLRELNYKCPNVFPIYSESHGKFTESHDGREPLSRAQSAVSNQYVSLIITRPYETAETKHAHTKLNAPMTKLSAPMTKLRTPITKPRAPLRTDKSYSDN